MAEGDARDYVLAFDNHKTEAARIAEATAEKLQNGQTNLLEVVKALGEYINDDDEKVRLRAINYLTAVISALPAKYLSRQQIQVLNQFLCSRIEDGGALEGLSKLQSLDRFTKEMAQDIVKAIFERFTDLQGRPQSGRFKIYSLLNELLSGHRKAVRELGDESLTGTVRLVAGEKDPRNLMLIFSMLRVIMIEWDISSHVDTLFDAVYAYFPITFRPPPNDPYGITAQDLKDRLRDCLASTGALAPQVFPNLLDRLDSTSDAVKKDVLQALAACARNYDPQTISHYSITLWDAVKFEVLQAQEPFLADEALEVINGIAASLSRTTEETLPTGDPLVQYLKPVNKECLEHLQEPASRQAKASGDILQAAASASVRAFETVLQGVGPALFTLQQSSEGIFNQRAILAVTNQLFEASLKVYGTWSDFSLLNAQGKENVLGEFKDKLVAIYSKALMSTVKEEVSYRLTALNGLLLLSQMRMMLADNEIGLFVQHFNDIVLDEESYGRDELKQRAISALAEISKFKPQLITMITFPKFIARLPDNEEEAAEKKDYQSVLEGLAEISSGKELLETLVRRLLNKLDYLVQSETRKDYPYTCAILSTIHYVLDRSAKDTDLVFDSYYDRLVVSFCSKAAVAKSGPLTDETVLSLLGRIVNLVIRRSTISYKDIASENVYRLFQDENTAQDIQHSNQHMLTTGSQTTFILSTWILAALPRATRSGVLHGSPIVLIKNLAMQAGHSTIRAIEAACLHQISLLVNKRITIGPESDEVDSLFNQTTEELQSSTSNQVKTDDLLRVRLIFSLAKAMILRLAPKTNDYLHALVNLLTATNPHVADFVALGFGTLLSSDEILSKVNDAQIRLLAPQRVFQTLVPVFASQFKGSASVNPAHEVDGPSIGPQKQRYLIALSGILGTVSSEIVMPELPTLLPLLLQSLDLIISDAPNQSQSVKVATLETLVVVITKNPDALIESGHIPALVRRLLATSKIAKSRIMPQDQRKPNSDQQLSTPQVRRLATHILGLLPKYVKDQKTPNPLLALKREVLQGVGIVLDDPRRDVRKEAVDTRAQWLRGVGEVESDEDE